MHLQASIYDVSSYPTYEKLPVTKKFTTYDRTYEIVTFELREMCTSCFRDFRFYFIISRNY